MSARADKVWKWRQACRRLPSALRGGAKQGGAKRSGSARSHTVPQNVGTSRRRRALSSVMDDSMIVNPIVGGVSVGPFPSLALCAQTSREENFQFICRMLTQLY